MKRLVDSHKSTVGPTCMNFPEEANFPWCFLFSYQNKKTLSNQMELYSNTNQSCVRYIYIYIFKSKACLQLMGKFTAMRDMHFPCRTKQKELHLLKCTAPLVPLCCCPLPTSGTPAPPRRKLHQRSQPSNLDTFS